MGGRNSFEKRIQRKFQQNAINDQDLLENYNTAEYLNGETVVTKTGNAYILWDNKWLDLPDWEQKEIVYGPIWDGGENSQGVTVTISRNTYVSQGYTNFIINSARWGISPSILTTSNPFSILYNWFTGGIDNMIHAEELMNGRMDTHNNNVRYFRSIQKN